MNRPRLHCENFAIVTLTAVAFGLAFGVAAPGIFGVLVSGCHGALGGHLLRRYIVV